MFNREPSVVARYALVLLVLALATLTRLALSVAVENGPTLSI